MDWIALKGLAGSEGGIVTLDEEYRTSARITLETECKVAPYAITCGIYGWTCHTRFFESEAEARAEYEKMKVELARIVESIPLVTDVDVDRRMAKTSDDIKAFVERFP